LPYLSKSKYLWGRQCRKLLWFAYNAKDQIPEPDAAQQAIFDQGHEVGALARQLFPGGIEVGQGIVDIETVLRLSQEATKQRRPMFEAAFACNGAYARVDILNSVDEDAWDVIEVKSSTRVKDVYLPDLAFQTFVYTGAGLRIRRGFILHINSDYVRQGDLDPRKLFKEVDVTAQVAKLSRDIEPQLDEMFQTIRLKSHPDVAIGEHCDRPYICPLHDFCWNHLPADHPVTLYRGKVKGFRLLTDGITSLKEIPESFPLTDHQQIQRTAAITGQPHVGKLALKQFLAQLKYPLHYLDFETFGTAIPLFDGTSPFEQIPFQFSLHVQRSPGLVPEHFSYLAQGRHDPRPEFMERLRAVMGNAGTVLVYNASFEKSVLDQCADLHAEFQPWVAMIKSRVVDLLIPFRSFRYYHPDQHGSASIKSVLPALTGRSYEGLDIHEGGTANREFLRVTFRDVPEAERQRVRRQLELYCGQDTEGMLGIVEQLGRLCR
jgi:hypothetical protein